MSSSDVPKQAERENVFPAFYRKIPLGWQPLSCGFKVVRAFLETAGVGLSVLSSNRVSTFAGKTFTVMRFSRDRESYMCRIVWCRLPVFDSRRELWNPFDGPGNHNSGEVCLCLNSMVERFGEPGKQQPMELTSDFLGESRHDFVAKLAYRLWEERGRPFGSPEVDWFAAERAVYSSLLASGLVTPSANGPQDMAEEIYR